MEEDQWNFCSGPSHSGSSIVFPPVAEWINGIDILRNWQNSHIGSQICRVRAIIVGKAKQNSPELLLPSKIVNQTQWHIPGGIAEISGTIKDLKDAGIMIFTTTCPLNSSIWPMKKTHGFWGMTMNDHKLNQVVTSTAAAVPDLVTELPQINISPTTWYAVIDLVNAFFLHTY